MALDKQTVPLPLTRGLDLGTASNLRDPNALSSGINCEQLLTGEIVKRNGFASVATPAATPITAIPVDNSLMTVNNTTEFTALQYLNATGSLNYVYPAGRITPRQRKLTAIVDTLVGTSTGFINYDVSYSGSNVLVAVAMAGGTEVRTYQFDANLNLVPAVTNPYYSVTGLSGASVKVVGSRVFVYQSPANTVRIYDSALTYSGVALSLGGSLAWDVCAWSGSGFVALYDNGASMTLAIYASPSSLTTSTTFSNTNITRACVFPQTIGSSLVAFIARSAGTKLTAFRYNSSLSLLGTADNSYGSNTVYNITGIAPAGINNILCVVEYGNSTAADVHERGIRCLYVSSSYTGTTTLNTYGVNMIRLGLASKPLQFASGDYPYFLVSHQSIDSYNLQNCYGLFQFGNPDAIAFMGFCGKFAYGQAENFISRRSIASNILPNFAAISSTRQVGVILTRSPTAFTSTAANSIFNLSFMDLTVDSYFQGSKPVRIGGYTVTASNGINLVDSASINEASFNLYPDKLVVADGGAGSIANGTYNYVAVLECYDNRGNLLESSTSEPTSFTVSGGPRKNAITYYGVGLCSRPDVRLVLYRTTDGGTIYYQVTSTTIIDAASGVIIDNVTDATLVTGKILYTTGGVAENIAPPNSNFVAAVKNRLWTFEQGSLDTLWFTKESREGLIPQFSDLLTLNVGRQFGALVGVAGLDDKVIVFKEFCVQVIVGDGPSENLVGGWSSPAVIAQGKGCISPRSITETPEGVFFQSQEGIYIVDKGMSVAFIGRPLYASEGTIISSAYDPVKNAVFFLTTSRVWVYYITTASWYEWTATNPIDLVYESGVMYLVTTSKILKLTANIWQDDSSNYQQLIRLGQFQFAGIQGYQRIYRLLVTGRSLADESGTVTVKNYFDANTTATDTQTIAQTALVSGNKMSLEVRPSKQKCETMQLEISHTANNSGLTINAVTAEVGALPGAGRRASTVRAT